MTEAKTDANSACVNADGKPILETTLIGTLNETNNNPQLAIQAPSPSRWGPNATEVVNKTGEIVVPAGETALITIELPTGTTPSDVRVATALVEGSFQAVASSLQFRLLSAPKSNQLQICDDNSQNTEAHTWNFGVKVSGIWYDPQVKNVGSTPPP